MRALSSRVLPCHRVHLITTKRRTNEKATRHHVDTRFLLSDAWGTFKRGRGRKNRKLWREREREREKEERETLVDTGKFVLTSYIRMKLARSISGLSSLLRSSSKERRELAVFQNERDKRNTCWTWFLTLSFLRSESSFRFLSFVSIFLYASPPFYIVLSRYIYIYIYIYINPRAFASSSLSTPSTPFIPLFPQIEFFLSLSTSPQSVLTSLSQILFSRERKEFVTLLTLICE